MITTVSAGAVLAKVADLAPMLSVALLKSSLLLIVVFGLAGLMRGTSAATRHLVWSLGLVGVLLIPLLSETLPWHWGVLPAVQEQAGPALGWTSAVAAYGAFIIPKVFGEQIKATTPEYALYGFAVFYFICLLLNWWYYLGPRAEIKNP